MDGRGSTQYPSKKHRRPKLGTLAAACPFCVSMFEEAANTLGVRQETDVKDIAELVAERLSE